MPVYSTIYNNEISYQNQKKKAASEILDTSLCLRIRLKVHLRSGVFSSLKIHFEGQWKFEKRMTKLDIT